MNTYSTLIEYQYGILLVMLRDQPPLTVDCHSTVPVVDVWGHVIRNTLWMKDAQVYVMAVGEGGA